MYAKKRNILTSDTTKLFEKFSKVKVSMLGFGKRNDKHKKINEDFVDEKIGAWGDD
jgi:hypothetical protein